MGPELAPFQPDTPPVRFAQTTLWRKFMEWKNPEFEEISLNCEINSYASAQL
jgi:coenzyme PQQ precursor peptide PqqA